jgi:hypothetical protein
LEQLGADDTKARAASVLLGLNFTKETSNANEVDE